MMGKRPASRNMQLAAHLGNSCLSFRFIAVGKQQAPDAALLTDPYRLLCARMAADRVLFRVNRPRAKGGLVQQQVNIPEKGGEALQIAGVPCEAGSMAGFAVCNPVDDIRHSMEIGRASCRERV